MKLGANITGTLPSSKVNGLRLANPGWIAVFVDLFRANPELARDPADSITDKGTPVLVNLALLEADDEMWTAVDGFGNNDYLRIARAPDGASYSIESALFDGSNKLYDLGSTNILVTEVHDLGARQPVLGYEALVSGTFTLTGSGYVDLGVTLPALGDDELFLVEVTGGTRADDISNIVSGRRLKRTRTGVAAGSTPDYGADLHAEGPGEQPFYFCELDNKNLGGSGGDYYSSAFGGSVGVLIKRIGN